MSALLRFVEEVALLPVRQADVLLPLIASALIQDAPEPVAVPPSLSAIIQAFWASVTRATPEATSEAVTERLRAAGISSETMQGLALRAGLAEVPGGALGIAQERRFETRTAPKPGQARGGALARFQLQAPSKSPR